MTLPLPHWDQLAWSSRVHSLEVGRSIGVGGEPSLHDMVQMAQLSPNSLQLGLPPYHESDCTALRQAYVVN